HERGRPPADDDAGRVVPLPARGRSQAFPAHERELRARRRAAGSREGQARETGTDRAASVVGDDALARRRARGRNGPVSDDPATTAPTAPSEVVEYLDHLAKERDVSPNTVRAYDHDLRDFVVFLGRYYGNSGWTWQGVDRLAMRGF